MKEPKEMNIIELKEYVNALEFEELEKFSEEFDMHEMDLDLDVIDLLTASRLYDFMQWRNNGNAMIEF